jgi:hypothetical protein
MPGRDPFMDYNIERRCSIQKVMEFVQGLHEELADLHQTRENRVLLRVIGRSITAHHRA